MAELMSLPLTVSCFSKIQIGFTFLVLAHSGSPGKGPLNGCVCVWSSSTTSWEFFHQFLSAKTLKLIQIFFHQNATTFEQTHFYD